VIVSEAGKPTDKGGPKLPPTVIEIIAQEEAEDNKWFRLSIGAAVVLHVVFFIMNWNFLAFAGDKSEGQQKKAQIYVVKQVKFEQPPRQEMKQIPKPKTKRVPIPDPTPDEPEPIRDEEPEEDMDFIPDDNLVLGVPDAPPPPEPEGPVRFVVGGNITEPVKLSGPNPIYPEAARRARIQGVVVLECTIGKDGLVNATKVLRGLPLGLTEAAVDAVKKWRFQASTLNGRPVEVLYILTVRFNLQ
jgi:protein TonB